MSDETTQDEHGKEVRAQYKKVIEPRPHEEDLTRVKVGPEVADYVYVDATTLFQLERLVPLLKDCKNKSQRAQAGKGFPKYCRDIADQAEAHWPAAGYVVRLGAHLADYDSDAARAIAGADVIAFPRTEILGEWAEPPAQEGSGDSTTPLPPLPEKAYPADAVAVQTDNPWSLLGDDFKEHADGAISLLAGMAPELADEAEIEAENAGAIPG